MKLLLLTAYFPPEIGSASHLFYELAESLVKKGYDVTVVTGFPKYHVHGKEILRPHRRTQNDGGRDSSLTLRMTEGKYGGRIFLKECVNGINIVRLRVATFPRNIPVFRGLWQFSVAFFLFIGGLFSGKQDFIFVYSPPLPLCISAYLLSRMNGIPFLVNLQDIFPQSAVDLGVLKNKLLIGFFKSLERFVYKKADYITVHSEGNREYVLNQTKGIDPEKVRVIPNWVDTDLIKPGNRDNQFRKEYSLNNKFVVSFAGIMGYSQDMDTIVDSANVLRDYKDMLFLLVGYGVCKKVAEEKVKRYNLQNVRFLPMQSRDKYPEVLYASDVCLVTLKKEVKTPVVPSKILNIMSSGRPIVASLDLGGDAPKLIKNADCGYCVEPGDKEKFAESILGLYNNRGLCDELGRNGRMYAERYLARDVCVGKYEGIVKRKNKFGTATFFKKA